MVYSLYLTIFAISLLPCLYPGHCPYSLPPPSVGLAWKALLYLFLPKYIFICKVQWKSWSPFFSYLLWFILGMWKRRQNLTCFYKALMRHTNGHSLGVSGCFCTIMAGMNSCIREDLACKAWNTYYLTLYRKSCHLCFMFSQYFIIYNIPSPSVSHLRFIAFLWIMTYLSPVCHK